MYTSNDINVTEQDIENGIKREARECPVAYALKRRFPKARVIVGRDKTWLEYPDAPSTSYEHSKDVCDWITRFDYSDVWGKPDPITIIPIGRMLTVKPQQKRRIEIE